MSTIRYEKAQLIPRSNYWSCSFSKKKNEVKENVKDHFRRQLSFKFLRLQPAAIGQGHNLMFQCAGKKASLKKSTINKKRKTFKSRNSPAPKRLCFVLRTGTLLPSIERWSFSYFRVRFLKMGNNTSDNGKLVRLSSLNHFHVQTFYQINKFV